MVRVRLGAASGLLCIGPPLQGESSCGLISRRQTSSSLAHQSGKRCQKTSQRLPGPSTGTLITQPGSRLRAARLRSAEWPPKAR